MVNSEIDKYLGTVVFTPAVVGYLIDGNRVCLGVRKKVSGGLGQDLIAGIGGKVGDEPEFANETSDEAMDREAKEEIGVAIREKKRMGRVRFLFSHKTPDSKWNQEVVIYQITKWDGSPEETESTIPAWFDKGQIPWNQMWEDNEHWLPKVLAGQIVNAIFLYSDDKRIAEYRFEEV